MVIMRVCWTVISRELFFLFAEQEDFQVFQDDSLILVGAPSTPASDKQKKKRNCIKSL